MYPPSHLLLLSICLSNEDLRVGKIDRDLSAAVGKAMEKLDLTKFNVLDCCRMKPSLARNLNFSFLAFMAHVICIQS